MKQSFLALLLLVFLCGCSDKDNNKPAASDGKVFSQNFVQVYVIPDAISPYMIESRYIGIGFTGREINNMWPAMRREFEPLSKKSGDLSFNDRLAPYSIKALGPGYSKIRVVCDKDFDALHPAGESLNDLVKLCAISFERFVTSGYDRSLPPIVVPDEFAPLALYKGLGSTPVFKLLNQVTPADLKLTEPRLYLYFTKIPPAGCYEFKVTVISSGSELTETVTAEFK